MKLLFMKKITLLIILVSLCGILSYVVPQLPMYFWRIYDLLKPFSVDFLTLNISNGNNVQINFTLNILLLIGALLFQFTRGKEMRLIRFLFSIIFASKIIEIITSFIFLCLSIGDAEAYFSWWTFLLSSIINIGWIYLSYRILLDLNKSRELDIQRAKYKEAVSESYIAASSTQRIFHLFIDLLVTILIFSNLFKLLIKTDALRSVLESIASVLGERGLILLIFVIFRVIYYVFFETIFQYSPAKFLSETKVIKNEEDTLTLKTAIYRTIYRFIPFEALSFIFNHTGWHDKWSDTSVIREKKTGVKGNYYFLLIPVIALCFIVTNYASFWYSSYLREVTFNEAHEKTMLEFDQKIKGLTTNDIIELYDKEDYNTLIYLKPEKINGNHIIFSLVSLDNTFEYHPDQESIEPFYVRNKTIWPEISLTKRNLKKGITANKYAGLNYLDPEQKRKSDKNEDEGIPLKGKKYIIKSIEPYFQPNLKLKDSYVNNNYIQLTITNMGWKANILKIDNVEGDIEWKGQFPQLIEGKRLGNYLTGTIKSESNKIKFDIVAQDSTHKLHVYRVEKDGPGEIENFTKIK